ncbi:MAG: DUF5723 family protein [Bacteroidota bacterium]
MKRIILLVCLLGCGFLAQAQHEMSAFTATGRAGVSTTMVRDYQSLGINPANLGMIRNTNNTLEKPKIVSFGIGEFAISVHSDALSKDALGRNLFSLNALSGGGDSLDWAAKAQAALDFADKGVELAADVLGAGVAITPSRAVGGFAIGVRDRFKSSFRFNTDAADLFFNGYNASYFDSTAVINGDTVGFATQPLTLTGLFNGSRFSLNWYRELHFAYGRVLLDEESVKIYAGVGAKYIMGMGYMDVDVREGFSAFSALGPVFDIDYGANTSPSSVGTGGGSTVGTGLGIDAGITLSFGAEEQFKVGASITDLGSITWDGNVYTANDTILPSLTDNGIDSYNLVDEIEEFGAQTNFVQWAGTQEVKVSLPTLLRFGASYRVVDQLELSADMVVPFSESAASLDKALFAFGVDVRPISAIRISTGLSTGAEFGMGIPVGLYFTAPQQIYEIGIASRDAITFFTQNTPTLSMAMGFLRFKL